MEVTATPFQIGTHVRPCDGEAVSGDAVIVRHFDDGVFLSLIDALGHGREAAEVALLAIQYLKKNASSDVVQVLHGLNTQLSGSRGAMATVAFGRSSDGVFTCTGIGNTTARRIGEREESFLWPDGVMGVRFRSPRTWQVRLSAHDLLVMHSDGVAEHFSVSATPALLQQPVGVIARRIVLDHGRIYDDAACIVARYEP